MRIPLLLFIIIPISELLLLFKVAEYIGGGYTLLLVICTAFVGITVLKIQGFSTLRRANSRLQSGQLPAQEIIEGMMLAFAGALLLTPGFITDVIGFSLLTPFIRRRLAARVLRSGNTLFMGSMGGGSFRAGGGQSHGRYRDPSGGFTVEGEYRDEDQRYPEIDRPDEDERR